MKLDGQMLIYRHRVTLYLNLRNQWLLEHCSMFTLISIKVLIPFSNF